MLIPKASISSLKLRLRSCTGWIFAALVLLLALQIRSWWMPTHDATAYLSIARSLATGHGFLAFGRKQLHFAPGYSLLISPAFLFPSATFLIISIIRFALSAGTLIAVYFWARRLIPRSGALIAGAAVGVNMSFWRVDRIPLSELPVMFWLFVSALAVRQLLNARTTRHTILWSVISLLLVTWACLTRQSALALGFGFTVSVFLAAFHRRSRWFRSIGLSAIVLLLPLIGVIALAKYDQAQAIDGIHDSYLDRLTEGRTYADIILSGLHLRTTEVGRLLVPGVINFYARTNLWRDPSLLLYIPIAFLVGTGWFKLARRTNDPGLWALPFYIGLFVAWPYDQGTRYLLPILPMLLVSIWPWFRKLNHWRICAAIALCITHLVFASMDFINETHRNRPEYYADWPLLEQMAAPINAHHEPTAVLGITRHANLWLQYMIDRRIEVVEPAEPIPPQTVWLVQPVTAEPPAEFETTQTAGPYRLSHRK